MMSVNTSSWQNGLNKQYRHRSGCVWCNSLIKVCSVCCSITRLCYKLKLTLCILMDFPIHIDTMSTGLAILYFKGFQKWIWYLLSLIYLSFHTYCQWKNFRKHLLLLVKSINNLSLPLRTISACIPRYYVIEATHVTVCYSAYIWFSYFDKYTVLLWFCCTSTTKMQTSQGYLTGWSAPLLFNISEVR